MAQTQNRNNGNTVKNIVAVRFSALGDVAMTLPALYSAAIENPDIRFFFLTRPLFAKFAVNPPENLKVIGVDLNGRYKGVLGMAKLARMIVKELKADILIDLHDVLRTKMLRGWVSLAGKKVTVINKGRSEKKALVASRNKQFRQLLPMTERYVRTIRNAGIEPGNNFRSVFDRIPADSSLYATVAGKDAGNKKRIGIAPFAKHQGKIYPLQKMEEVVKALSEIPDAEIFLFGGGKEEAEVLGKWEKKYPGTISLADKKLGFAAELALMSTLKVMLSMDSGNMHLASLCGTPVVSVWGATHPYCGFMGFRQKESDAVQLSLPCRPCSVFGDKKCIYGNYKCLNEIKTEDILRKISEKLRN